MTDNQNDAPLPPGDWTLHDGQKWQHGSYDQVWVLLRDRTKHFGFAYAFDWVWAPPEHPSSLDIIAYRVHA